MSEAEGRIGRYIPFTIMYVVGCLSILSLLLFVLLIVALMRCG